MYEYTMSENRHDLLAGLARGLPENFYLAGGTALALQLGHRWSEDLDFFSEHKFDSFSLIAGLSKIDEFLVTGQEEGTVHGLMENVKLSFLYYPYSLNLDKYIRINVNSFIASSGVVLLFILKSSPCHHFISS